MHRRRVLVAAGTLLGGLAGCSGTAPETERAGQPPEEALSDSSRPTPTPTPTPQRLVVPEYAFEEGESGGTVVVLTLRNRGSGPAEATVTVEIAGPDEHHRTERDVSLEAGAETTVRFPFDVAWSWFRENRNLRGVSFS